MRVRSPKFPSERKKLGSGIGGGVFHPVADHFVLGRFTSRDEIFSGGGLLSGEFPKSGMLVVDMAMGQHGRADADVALEQRGQTSSLTHNGGNRTADIPGEKSPILWVGVEGQRGSRFPGAICRFGFPRRYRSTLPLPFHCLTLLGGAFTP